MNDDANNEVDGKSNEEAAGQSMKARQGLHDEENGTTAQTAALSGASSAVGEGEEVATDLKVLLGT